MNKLADLDFMVPNTITSVDGISKAYLYSDNIHTGSEIVDYLKALIVSRTGISTDEASQAVRPFNAVMSDSYREESMDAFRRGSVRILVCTDAAGMVSQRPRTFLFIRAFRSTDTYWALL